MIDDETVGSLLGSQHGGGGGGGGMSVMGAKTSALAAPLEFFVTIHPRC